jgi:outer membrane lipoprotein LolB
VRLPAEAPWPARRAELQRVSHYEVKGRVAVAAGGEGFDARLRWVQEGARAQLSLSGPFGAGGVQVTSEGNSLSVVTSRGERLGDEDAREQLVSHLGFEPPLASLRYWMLGVPDPGQPVGQEVLGDGRLTRLEQGGWQIDYTAYMPVHTHDMGQTLPAKVTLQRADVRVRLLVETWSD